MSEREQSLQPVFIRGKSIQIPAWKEVYERTIWESGTEQLLTLIHITKAALYHRWQELRDGPEDEKERAEMEAAAKELLAIKIHKLGWPDPCR
jgi:hypothetical protein